MQRTVTKRGGSAAVQERQLGASMNGRMLQMQDGTTDDSGDATAAKYCFRTPPSVEARLWHKGEQCR